MEAPKDLFYTKEHEWVRIDGSAATMGISDHAQVSLGDITFIELPQAGKEVKQFAAVANIESVKAASDIYSPLSGKVVEANEALSSSPDLINGSCYADGWICKLEISDSGEKDGLMDAAAYEKYLTTLQA